MLQFLLSNPSLVTLVAGIPSLITAFIGYRKAVVLDRQASAAEPGEHILTLAARIDSLNAHVDMLQKSNQSLRDDIAELLKEKVAAVAIP